MHVAEYPPSNRLKPYIDAYWVMQTDAIVRHGARRFFVDGFIDLFINMGSSTPVVNNTLSLAPGKMYLNSAMRTSLTIANAAGSYFVGVRFKPGGFPALYRTDLEEIVDQIYCFHDTALSGLLDVDQHLFHRLDEYFVSRINNGFYPVIPIAETVREQKGRVSVDALASRHNVTTRTLERLFHTNIGVTPKEFISIVKFQNVLEKLRHVTNENLFGIAVDAGYYDHAHMTREFKKIAGATPSQIAQSFQANGSIVSAVVA